jgi:DNA topoisomerase-1
VNGGALKFRFKGKSGKRHEIELRDAKIARIVRRVQELPGQELFQFVDENGQRQDVKSEDVNDYLREVAGREFSAKDFRTWAGTVLAAIALRQLETFRTKTQAKKNLVAAIERVAERLGNTPAVCRKCYIHPVILDSYLAGRTVDVILDKTEDVLSHASSALTGSEGAVLAFLQQRLRSNQQPALLTSLRRSVAEERQKRKGRDRDDRDASGGGRAAARSPGRKLPPSARRRPRAR